MNLLVNNYTKVLKKEVVNRSVWDTHTGKLRGGPVQHKVNITNKIIHPRIRTFAGSNSNSKSKRLQRIPSRAHRRLLLLYMTYLLNLPETQLFRKMYLQCNLQISQLLHLPSFGYFRRAYSCKFDKLNYDKLIIIGANLRWIVTS